LPRQSRAHGRNEGHPPKLSAKEIKDHPYPAQDGGYPVARQTYQLREFVRIAVSRPGLGNSVTFLSAVLREVVGDLALIENHSARSS